MLGKRARQAAADRDGLLEGLQGEEREQAREELEAAGVLTPRKRTWTAKQLRKKAKELCPPGSAIRQTRGARRSTLPKPPKPPSTSAPKTKAACQETSVYGRYEAMSNRDIMRKVHEDPETDSKDILATLIALKKGGTITKYDVAADRKDERQMRSLPPCTAWYKGGISPPSAAPRPTGRTGQPSTRWPRTMVQQTAKRWRPSVLTRDRGRPDVGERQAGEALIPGGPGGCPGPARGRERGRGRRPDHYRRH